MPRRNYNPKNFELNVDHPWTMAIHTNDMIVLNPQLDLDHPDDLDTQTVVSCRHIGPLLAEFGASHADIVNLRVSYVNTGDVDEDAYRARVLELIPGLDGAVIDMVPFDRLVLPELLVEICTYAMKPQDGRGQTRKHIMQTGLQEPGTGAAHGLRVGHMVFTGQQAARDRGGAVIHPGNVRAQAERLLDHLEATLSALSADLEDVVRLNVFYDVCISPEDWAGCLALFAARFESGGGPAFTAIPLPRMFPAGCALTVSAWAMRAEDGARLAMRRTPGGRTTPCPLLWRQTVACEDMIFAGGLSSMNDDETVVGAGDHLAQTEETLDAMERSMSAFGASLEDVHKTNSYYVLNTVDQFNANLQIRSDRFSKPGPGSVGLPLDALGAAGQAIEIEAIGILK